jgi:glycosyltransferase involved in cell wall biosynthesis
MMKVSVCITTKNEEDSINRLIGSLLKQTRLPDEIVIVDNNSTDQTQELIKKYPQVKLLTTTKKGIAVGRNLAIQNASNEIIAMIDAGCTAKKDWLEQITKPFIDIGIATSPRATRNDTKSDLLVAGFYEMPYTTPLQQVMSVYHGIPPERFDEHKFLPSARSVAFTKTVWKKAGKFNEQLEKAGEDTQFFYNCVKIGVKIIRVKSARVVWEESAKLTLMDSLKKFYSYAKGDAKTGIWFHPEKQFASHNIKISLIFIRYLLAFAFLAFGFFMPVIHVILLILVLLYLIYPVVKWMDVVKSWQGRLWLPVVQITSDLAVMAGFLRGIIEK